MFYWCCFHKLQGRGVTSQNHPKILLVTLTAVKQSAVNDCTNFLTCDSSLQNLPYIDFVMTLYKDNWIWGQSLAILSVLKTPPCQPMVPFVSGGSMLKEYDFQVNNISLKAPLFFMPCGMKYPIQPKTFNGIKAKTNRGKHTRIYCTVEMEQHTQTKRKHC